MTDKPSMTEEEYHRWMNEALAEALGAAAAELKAECLECGLSAEDCRCPGQGQGIY